MMVKELCKNIVGVRRVSDRVMSIVLVFEDVMRLICGCVSGSVEADLWVCFWKCEKQVGKTFFVAS